MKLRGVSVQQRIAVALAALVGFGIFVSCTWGWLSYAAPFATRTVDTTADNAALTACTAAADDCSLRGAISGAANGDTINFDTTVFAIAQTITLGSELSFSKSLTIQGPGETLLTLNGNDAARIFNLSGVNTITLSGLTLANGLATIGGGIYSNLSSGGSLTVLNCTFDSNTATAVGGGGGISTGQGALVVTDSTFITNSAPSGVGGAIAASSIGAVTVDNTLFEQNSASSNGGGINRTSTGALTVTESTFDTNSSGNDGGGIHNGGTGTATVTSNYFSGNTSDRGGGLAATASGGNTTISLSTIINNTVTVAGGGIYNNAATLTVMNCHLTGNSATSGGALFTGSSGNVTVTKSTISGNNASSTGGGINMTGATLSVTNSTLANNTVGGSGGGGLSCTNGTATLTNVTVAGNSAASGLGGGGIYKGPTLGTVNLKNTLIATNTASFGPDICNTIVSQGYNLIGKTDGGSISAMTGDQLGTTATPINPVLSALDLNNGGPTQTMALLTGSPAIDKGGAASGVTTDQRGSLRPYDNPGIAPASGGDNSDIGAFEVQPVCNAPTIITPPIAQTVCAGASASFSVAATGTSLSYQWRKGGVNLTDGGNISGATTATLTINPAGTGDAGSYDVVVTEACGQSTTSSAAALTVNGYTLSRTSQYFTQNGFVDDVSVTAASGCSWTAVSNDSWITIFTSVGSGNGTVNYQVTANPGATDRTGAMTIAGQTFTVTQGGTPCITSITPSSNIISANGGAGSFEISAPAGCAWTATTYSAFSWITLTGNTSGTGNGTVNYTVAANPNSTARSGQVFINGAGHQVSQIGTGADCTVMPITVGQTVQGSLNTSDCFSPMQGAPSRADRYSFSGTAGQQIALSVVSADYSPGIFLIGPDGNLLASNSGYITPHARLPIGSGHLTLPANGTYFIDIIALEYALSGAYALSLTQPGCINPSSSLVYLNHNAGTGTLNINAPAGCNWTATSNADFLTITNGGSGTGNGSINYSVTANSNNSQRLGTITVGGEFTVVTQFGDGSCFPAAPLSSGVQVSGTVESSDCGSPLYGNNYRADRYTFQGTPGQQITLALNTTSYLYLSLYHLNNYYPLATNSGGVNTQLQSTLTEIGTYVVEIAAWHYQMPGNYTLTLTGCAPATITTQPVNQTACATYNATFIAAASGDPAPTVQWQVSTDNGANFSDLSGATNAGLMLSGLTTAMNGNQYRAVFTNSCGTATSNAATLTVNTLTINPAAVPDGVLGSAYSQAFTATGGLGIPSVGYNGSVPGLSFNSAAATLAGTPTLAGSFPFNISAVESACNGNRGYTLKVGLLNLAATGAEGRVDLNWTHSGFSGVNGFKLYRATDVNGPYALVNGALGAGQSAVSDSSVMPNTVYWYKLTVVRADGVESSFSNPAAATPVDVIAPVITHTPFASPQPPGVALLLAATVTDNTAVQSVKLFFRTTGAGSYTERTMTGSGSNYAATLAANEVVTPGLDYYLEASDGISVTRSGQADNPQRITVVDQPFLNGLTPNTGPAAGGTTVTLNGFNFSANAVVRFDNALATITSVSATQIVCTTPPHFPATVDVRVTNPNGTNGVKVGAFEYTGTQAALSLPANAASPQGVRVQIPVNAAGVQGLTAADLRFTFDSAVISAVSAVTGTLTPGWSLQANLATPGEVRLALASNSGPVSGTGTLAVVEFDVLGAPASTSSLSFGVVTLNGGAIAVATTNGLFTVAPVYSIAGTVRQWFTNLGLSNVALTLNQQGGTRSYTATSQASGAYTVNSVLGGDYTLTPRKFDQAVGITSQDAVKVLLHSIGITPLSGHALTAADVNRNGTANTQDAFSILQYVVGLINLPFPGAGRVWDFAPQTRSYTNLNSDQTGQDFTGILLGDVTGNYTQPPNRPVNPATVATLALPGVTLLPNSQTTLLLGLDLPQGQLLSGELRINYDPAVLSIVGVESGALVSDWLQAANTETPGLLRIALAGSRAVTTGGEFLRITVQTSGAPGVSSALSIAQGNLNDGEIGATLIPGAVTTASSPTALLVSGIAPASGPTSGGTSVTISGANFTPNATVIIGGVAATNVTFVDAQTLRATTGGHAAGLADVVVTQAGSGSSTLARGFSYSNGNVCQAALATTTQRFPATGGTGSVQVTTGSGCTWTVDSHSEWITPVTSGGTGNGVVQFTVARNTGLERTGWLTIAGQSFVITQGAKNASADFDGDGKTDLAVWRGATGNWLILRSTNSAVQSFTWGTSNAPYEDLIVPADYDGDGKADTAVWRQLDGTWYIVNSATGATTAQAWGTRGDVPVAGDYDGDGKADLAVWRPGDGRWYVWRSSDGGYTIEAWGQQGDLVVPGDYDGDGRADLAIWRPGNGTWYIKRSSGGTQVTAWGAGYAPYFDVPVQADYDGDGKTDLAIWRGADSLWYIRRSSDGQPITQLWGANYAPYRDVPVPGDYDGDGKADIAVWRPTSATWFVLHSTDGSFLVQPHGQSGDTPVSAVGVR